MRTTVIIEDVLADKLKTLASKKGLSEFINQCLQEHFRREERLQRLQKLEKAYARAASRIREQSKITEDFEDTDREDWPAW